MSMVEGSTSDGSLQHEGVKVAFDEGAIELTPQLGALTDRFIEFCDKIQSDTENIEGSNQLAATDYFKKALNQNELVTEVELSFLFAQSVLLDLIAQGWKLEVRKKKVFIFPPEFKNKTNDAAKDQIRSTHLLGRDIQLSQKSVREFIKDIQRQRLTSSGWHSIYSLMRDGEELAERLRPISKLTHESERLSALAKVISPYLQFVGPKSRCEYTGLRLVDIWRYFRHTWVNEYKSIPGRSIMILIRDAAATNHPVIGIAALGSSVVQHKVRDKWIGWLPETLVEDIVANPKPELVDWLLTSVERLISDIYSDDLISEDFFSTDAIHKPTVAVSELLLNEADRAIKAHRKEPQRAKHGEKKKESAENYLWRRESETFLYRSKRCKQLARLFSIRRTFQKSGFSSENERSLKSVVQKGEVKSAISQLVRMIKAEHVGVDMMDITVCGAIAPYNSLLGGKLVCMLLCSPEITQHYSKRYSKQVSVIASAMKGKPVIRTPNLVLLCTTSLYGVGSSQYNRVKLPLREMGVESDQSIDYKELGHSFGFGTYHFSRTTIQLGSNLNSRKKDGRHINSIFGEGVNPLMRKIRESLDYVGLNSDELLQHGNKRVTYGIELATNFREILLGRANEPKYLMPQQDARDQTKRIGEYWRKRWLSQRINRPGILESVAKHKTSHPRSHGAIVPISDKDEIEQNGFPF